MKTVTCTREMTASRQNSIRAFTLIELLVVIAIIAVVAGLVVGLAAIAGSKGRISRAQTENARLATLINSYQAKMGVYPPHNKNNPGHNTLLYELAGAIRDTNNTALNPNYITPFANVQANVLNAQCGVNGIQNSVDIFGETNQVHRLLKDIRPDQTNMIGGILSLVVPVDDPNRSQPNTWKYLVGEDAVHNKGSFDLWVEIYARGKSVPGVCTDCIIIGNWKD
jgi:prepilin-type N-terminal cleavage/methylation domain-containing protein